MAAARSPKGARPAAASVAAAPAAAEARSDKTVMKKYTMHMGDDDVMGEGTSSICRKGTVNATKEFVAIKIYKVKKKSHAEDDDVNEKKFTRQIHVLKDLMEPLKPTADPTLWDEKFANIKPSKIFMQLIDYSQTADGVPAADADDGQMYVVTELASYSLKDYLKLRREQAKPLSNASVLDLTKAILMVMAGLHAKQLVHLDMKPENMMVFNGCLKLIDVDGCVRIGTTVAITDSSLSFSPCYCAPEWANFLIEDSDEPQIVVAPGLDVWSVGMTICEVVALDATLKPTYASFMRHGRSQREAGFLFMDWLSSLKKAPIPKKIAQADPQLVDLLANHLLVPDPAKRKSCAQCLKHPYVYKKAMKKSTTSPLTAEEGGGGEQDGGADVDTPNNHAGEEMPEAAPRDPRVRGRQVDDSDQFVHQGTLLKLNLGANKDDLAQWLLRDMWISNNGSLCYFSHKENKRLVLLDANRLAGAEVSKFDCKVKDNAFEIKYKCDVADAGAEETKFDTAVFACDSPSDYAIWISLLSTSKMKMMESMHLGKRLAQDLKQFRLTVKNRRMKVPSSGVSGDQFEAVFKTKLAKLKADGDRMQPADWFEREMWLSRNGSLVYHSQKEDRDLVYYTAGDVAHATLSVVDNAQSARPWTFSVELEPCDGISFTAGDFAAESAEVRDKWIAEFARFSTKGKSSTDLTNRRPASPTK